MAPADPPAECRMTLPRRVSVYVAADRVLIGPARLTYSFPAVDGTRGTRLATATSSWAGEKMTPIGAIWQAGM